VYETPSAFRTASMTYGQASCGCTGISRWRNQPYPSPPQPHSAASAMRRSSGISLGRTARWSLCVLLQSDASLGELPFALAQYLLQNHVPNDIYLDSIGSLFSQRSYGSSRANALQTHIGYGGRRIVQGSPLKKKRDEAVEAAPLGEW
jgi:hypothetical protein